MRALPYLVLTVCVLAALIGCDGGRDQLLANLQSDRPEERASAVRKLGEKNRSDDLVLFTRAAKDTSPFVRGEAAAALGKSGDARVVDLLGDLLADPDEHVQAAAAKALAKLKTPKAESYLRLQYARRGRATRQAIVEGLEASNMPGAMATVVAAEAQTLWDRNLQALSAGALPERVAAAEELGKSGRPEAVNLLLPLIKDSHVVLAAAAVRGLGHAGDARAVEPVSELLRENFPELREAALEALARIGDPRALPRLREVALEKSAASPRAAQGLVTFPAGEETHALLCEVVHQGGVEEASLAARAMRSRGGCPLEPLLERLTRRADQAAALSALEALGPTAAAAAPRVLPLLSSTDVGVKMLALSVLTGLRDPSAAEPVTKLYEAEVERVASMRAKWIPKPLPTQYAEGFGPHGMGSEEPTPDTVTRARQGDLLEKARAANEAKREETGKTATVRTAPPVEVIDDVPEEELRLLAASLRALGAVKAEGAQALLEPWTSDGSPLVRAAASVGLAQLGPEGVKLAARGLLDGSREVQAQTAGALADAGEPGQRVLAELLTKLAGDRLPLLLALERAGPQPVMVEALVAVLREGGPESAVAAQLLGRLGAKDAVQPLLRVLEDANAVARRDALIALGRIGEAGAAEGIARELNHDSPDVRAAAIDALAALRSEVRAGAVDALKSDYYRRVRESAEAALVRTGRAAAAAGE